MAYSNIKDPSAHFQVKKWTGNAGTNAITLDGNSDMQPDFMWHKEQNDTNGWHQFDSSRGVTKYLATNSSAGEGTFANYLSSFNSNGFTAGSGDSSMNSSSTAQCSWLWKANGGTTSSNTDGNITATVQANTTAGFSIVTYTGNGVQTGKTVGHGLGAVPKMIISKDRGGSSNVPTWRTYHVSIGATKYLQLPQNDAASTYNDWDNTTPTSSVYSVGGAGGYTPTNTNNTNYVAYVFAEVQGYSKFGKYIGNGASDAAPATNGPFIYTGFSPAFVLIKKTSAADDWLIFDNKRAGYDPAVYRLFPGSTSAETSGTNNTIQFTSNGFKIRFHGGSMNTSGGTYIYMAFAENPFVAGGIPTTAR